MNFQASRNELLGRTAVKNLNARFFDACLFVASAMIRYIYYIAHS